MTPFLLRGSEPGHTPKDQPVGLTGTKAAGVQSHKQWDDGFFLFFFFFFGGPYPLQRVTDCGGMIMIVLDMIMMGLRGHQAEG